MRIKTVPRHLPRKNSTQEFTRGKDTETSAKIVSTKKLEVGGPAVNFTMYEDVAKEMNSVEIEVEIKAEPIIAEECKPGPSDVSVVAPNFPIEEANESQSFRETKKLEDSYLYKIMTDPSFVDSIKRNKQISANCCPYCKKDFGSQAELKKHSVSSTLTNDSNRLTCCACGKSFAQKRYLRYHQNSHLERNKYTCNICTRKYSRHDNLTRHNIFHTNPDKFPCNSCERTFARKDLLNKHLKRHENKYKFHCDICQKYFKGPVKLANHLKLFHSDCKVAS